MIDAGLRSLPLALVGFRRVVGAGLLHRTVRVGLDGSASGPEGTPRDRRFDDLDRVGGAPYGARPFDDAFLGRAMNDPTDFYNGLAQVYHLIFEDWDRSIARQGAALTSVMQRWSGARSLVLDVSCGIGTQAIGLALRGFDVAGSDLAVQAVARARREAGALGARAGWLRMCCKRCATRGSTRCNASMTASTSRS